MKGRIQERRYWPIVPHPEEDGFGGLVVVEAAIELLAEVVGEVGDFSVTHTGMD